MDPATARLLFADWAASLSATPDPAAGIRREMLRASRPHIFPPAVPVALRGPKWGQRR